MATQKERFEKERGRVTATPPPEFPELPEVFVSRYDPEVQAALRKYSTDCKEWVRKYVTGQT